MKTTWGTSLILRSWYGFIMEITAVSPHLFMHTNKIFAAPPLSPTQIIAVGKTKFQSLVNVSPQDCQSRGFKFHKSCPGGAHSRCFAFEREWPFQLSGKVTPCSLSWRRSSDTYALPEDFNIDSTYKFLDLLDSSTRLFDDTADL
jgi:hypothetical protein